MEGDEQNASRQDKTNGQYSQDGLQPQQESQQEPLPPPTRALILMDSFCPYHGLYMASTVRQFYPGVMVVHLLSDYLRGFLEMNEPENNGQWEAARIPTGEAEINEWKSRIGKDVELVGVYCESDSGLADAEKVRQTLGVSCQDDPVVLEDRRNKYLMNERVAKMTGLPVVRQKMCTTLEQAKEFANDLFDRGIRAVVKPHRGVATESVFLCETTNQVVNAWDAIIGTSIYAEVGKHNSVLVQEHLVGTEYAVDMVARDGDYKAAAIWRYDKGRVNDAPFCYFRTQLVDDRNDSAETIRAVVEYVQASLTALGVRWGQSHSEVIVTRDRGPVLVEVNCRQHNMDFAPLTMLCIGYSAWEMTLDAFLENDKVWETIPKLPQLRNAGCMVHLVNYATGKLSGVNHLEDIEKLESILDMEIYPRYFTPGAEIVPTTDIRTDAGWVQLASDDAQQVEQDYRKIVEWMPTMFEVENDRGK